MKQSDVLKCGYHIESFVEKQAIFSPHFLIG